MNSILLNQSQDSKSAISFETATLHSQNSYNADRATNDTKILENLESIRAGLRDVACENALSLKQLIKGVVEQVLQISQRLWRMNGELKRKEYRVFLQVLGWTTAKARKYINLAKTFDGFDLSQITGIELTTLLSLCSSRYQKVVAQLREMPVISQELVEQLMKQSRSARKPLQEPISGWKQCRSGGGRYYNLLLHDEHTGLLIQEQALAEGVLPQRIIADAVALRAQSKATESQQSEDMLARMDEFKPNEDPVVSPETSNSSTTQQLGSETEVILKDSVVENAILAVDNELPSQEQASLEHERAVNLLLKAKTWEEVALIVKCDRDYLIKTATVWTSGSSETIEDCSQSLGETSL